MTLISVVVPAYNEEKTIKACLDSIRDGFYKDYEIIVVAGGKDNTIKVASEYGKAVPDENNTGAGPARNQGARLAKGEVVVFTDADGYVNPHWLERYAKAFEDESVVAAGGPVKPIEGRWLDKLMFRINQDWLYQLTPLVGFYQFSGQNCAYRRKQFLKAGGFDESMSMMEDTELSNRMKRYGKAVYLKDNVTWSSPRRMQRKGYFRLFLKFMRAYFSMYVLGKPPKEAYFASAK